MKKLRNKRGETLVEMLIAILIFTLSSVVLYSMITTATEMNTLARENDEKNQAQMVAVELQQGDALEGSVTVTVTSPNGTVKTLPVVNVSVYGETDGLYAYYPK